MILGLDALSKSPKEVFRAGDYSVYASSLYKNRILVAGRFQHEQVSPLERRIKRKTALNFLSVNEVCAGEVTSIEINLSGRLSESINWLELDVLDPPLSGAE